MQTWRHTARRTQSVLATGIRMMWRDRARFFGTTFGVVFAVLICVQQLGVLFGLLQKNTQFVDNARADIFLTPRDTKLFQPGALLDRSLVDRVGAVQGVRAASPLVVANATIRAVNGGTQPLTLIGVDPESMLGGPWNLVAGQASVLRERDTIVLEDSKRDDYGGVNLGSVREVNGYRVRVGAFTWGLEPFGPAYAFSDIDLARDLTGIPTDKQSFVLVQAAAGTAARELARKLRDIVPPEYEVKTQAEYRSSIVSTLLSQQLGVSFGTSTSFGLLIGLVVVSLAMFGAVLEHQRQFGILKAVGCTNVDLSILVLAQSLVYGLCGSVVGLALVVRLAELIRQPSLSVIIPWQLLLMTPVVMTLLSLLASLLALSRVRRLEPAMVFR